MRDEAHELEWDPDDGILIRFEDVHKSFDGQAILRGLSFEVRRGSTYAIMGRSGTGKSVTLRHVVGLLVPDRGHVTVAGREPARLDRRSLQLLRRHIGYLFQDGALINWLSVFDNVALPLREGLRLEEPVVQAEVREALQRVELDGAGHKLPNEISGGMRKRVALARAIVIKPKILLYDEPNAGLDPGMANNINRLIRDIQSSLGVTSIVVTHRRECALNVANRIAIFEDGRILVEGTATEMMNSPHPRVREFLGEDRIDRLDTPIETSKGIEK